MRFVLSKEEQEMLSCLNPKHPRSFFLFAGAGSGKTRSLVKVLQGFKSNYGRDLRKRGQQVAVITYTNAACEEIRRRIDFDRDFAVSTIHSFAWQLIQHHQVDIKDWVKEDLNREIQELQEKQRMAQSRSQASNQQKLEFKTRRRSEIDQIKKFTYDPNGLNESRHSLNHSQVIKIASDFIRSNSLFQRIVVSRYPVILIDESQDTRKELMEALFGLTEVERDAFSLGLFGDTMQRIYFDGKPDLGQGLPRTWATPQKTTNYRSPVRIVKLINAIRMDQPQTAARKKTKGTVRLFIIGIDAHGDKMQAENEVREEMALLSQDNLWTSDVKILALEHAMAARRQGFAEFFEALYRNVENKTSVLDGSLQGLPFLTQIVCPFIELLQKRNDFALMALLRKHSPLLRGTVLNASESPLAQLRFVAEAVASIGDLFSNGGDPKLVEIFSQIERAKIFDIPELLLNAIKPAEDGSTEEHINALQGWPQALAVSYSQLRSFSEYISDRSQFGTHQGVKGLEFPRVLAILDDAEAGGNFFSYDKLFGARKLSDTDLRNIDAGNESTLDRTRRLFYVICSRATESLAIIVYTNERKKIRSTVLENRWFDASEVVEWSK